MLNEWYSAPIPRTKALMMRPPLMTSIIATSSATRMGWSRSGSALPTSAILTRRVRATSMLAMILGAGISP
jgi:hypothetical protein